MPKPVLFLLACHQKSLKCMTTENSIIEGFSRLSRQQKEELLLKLYSLSPECKSLLSSFRHQNNGIQDNIESISENPISNYHLPLGIAPNFLINGRMYALPMVTEESSVVAAASYAAKYWATRGGFTTHVFNTLKTGQIHFLWDGPSDLLHEQWPLIRKALHISAEPVEESMKKRGGGIRDINLRDKTLKMPGYYQVDVSFETADAMGANFINTCLETMAHEIKTWFASHPVLNNSRPPEIIMSILSNYTPDCVVQASIKCPIDNLIDSKAGMEPLLFAEKLKAATDIAAIEVNRAVTHNKGIMNGVDAIVMATGNDFRATEANVHAYAARDGQYRGLTHCSIEDGTFSLSIRLPLALGTVGGLTGLHPLAKFSMDLLGKPKATELMQIAAAAGLASNFAALSSLVSSGIQKGHMKMHLSNILSAENATPEERRVINEHFAKHTVSVNEVKKILQQLRKK